MNGGPIEEKVNSLFLLVLKVTSSLFIFATDSGSTFFCSEVYHRILLPYCRVLKIKSRCNLKNLKMGSGVPGSNSNKE